MTVQEHVESAHRKILYKANVRNPVIQDQILLILENLAEGSLIMGRADGARLLEDGKL